MSALGHYFEEEGIPTVSISLIREHTAAIKPPRALWVPFMLGRPLGVPNDAAFQRKVMAAALELLEREVGPVLDDFPEDAPYEDLGAEPEGLACPVTFPRLRSEGTLAERLADEIGQLQVWHDLAVRHRGRTTLGATGLSPAGIGEFLIASIGDGAPVSYRPDLGVAAALKLATDELKAYYYEAKSVQPGRHSPSAIENWFWMETSAGQVFFDIYKMACKSDDPSMKPLATVALVPRVARTALKARDAAAGPGAA